MLIDALDSPLAAFQHFHLGASQQTARWHFSAGFVYPPQVLKYRLFISAAASLNCVRPELKALLRPLMLNSTGNGMKVEHHLGACGNT